MTAAVTEPGIPVRGWTPGQFVFVMSTGILTVGLHLTGPRDLAFAFLALAAASYLELVLAGAISLIRYPSDSRGRLSDPPAQLQLFTVGIGTEVLASGFTVVGLHLVGVVLFCIGGVICLGLVYSVPALLSRGGQLRSRLDEIGGLWLLWPVALMAVAVASAVLATDGTWQRSALSILATVFWVMGIFVGLPLMSLVLGRLLLTRQSISNLRPSYWMVMGSAAISSLAAALIAGVAGGLTSTLGLVLALGAFVLWAVSTGLLPVLAAFTLARLRHRDQLGGGPRQIWMVVFPIAIYATASGTLGHVLTFTWLTETARVVLVIAVLAWLIELGRAVGLRLLGTPPGVPIPSPGGAAPALLPASIGVDQG